MNDMRIKKNLILLIELFLVSTKLGLTSFGGPVAHIAYFHEEYVRKKKWLDEQSYADLIAISQFLPGPASSQVGIGIGVIRAGILGGIVSFIGFTFPSVILLIFFAKFMQHSALIHTGWIHGLKIVAVSIVAHAILGMSEKLTPDLKTKSVALFSIIVTLLWTSEFSQIVIILLSGIIGLFLFKKSPSENNTNMNIKVSKRFALVCLTLFFLLFLLLPILNKSTTLTWVDLFDRFYRTGGLVFGGGHVVLPLLQQEFVQQGLINKETFLAGYGATQAVPGPLFTFAAYLGAVLNGWKGGLIATFAIFLPAFLLILGSLPFWNTLRRNNRISNALIGINAAVVGILIASFYEPIWTSTILNPMDFVFAAILFSMISHWKLAPWIVVLTGVVGGFFFF